MSYYLDTNVVVSTMVSDTHSRVALEWIKRTIPPFFIGTFTTIEFAAVVARLVRNKNLADEAGRHAMATFDQWLVFDAELSETSTEDIETAGLLIREFALKLSAPDAIHLAQARRLRAQLVTFDVRLSIAAQAIDVSVIVPS